MLPYKSVIRILPFIVLGLMLIMVVTGTAIADSERNSQDFNRDNQRVWGIPLDYADGRATDIFTVRVNVGGTMLEARTRMGVNRVDQNRLDYSVVPLIGKLSRERFDKADFTDKDRIGSVYRIGETLYLDLSRMPPVIRFENVIVANQSHSYEIIQRPFEIGRTAPQTPPGEVIGAAYAYGKDKVVVLIRPFVVTDSPVF